MRETVLATHSVCMFCSRTRAMLPTRRFTDNHFENRCSCPTTLRPSLSSLFVAPSYLRVQTVTRMYVHACRQSCEVRILFLGAAYLWPAPLALSKKNKTWFMPKSFSWVNCPIATSLISLMYSNDGHRPVDRRAVSDRKG
jgi:hypothetical protein